MSFAVCLHSRGQQSGDKGEPGQHFIITVSAIWCLAVSSLLLSRTSQLSVVQTSSTDMALELARMQSVRSHP